MVLPSEYKQVKYIQSTATNQWTKTSSWQVIDTLFTPTPNTKISIDLAFTNTTTQGRLFWVQTEESWYCTFCSYINWSSQRARAFKDWVWNWISSWKSVDTARHTFELDKEWYRIYTNWTQIYNADNQATPTKSWHHTLPLFCAWENTGDSWQTYNRYLQHGSYKLYGCKIRDNNTLVRDFVPVIRVSDNKPWLYDLVNDVFYTNAGTWEFTYEKYAEKGKFSKILLWEDQIYPPVSPGRVLFDDNYLSTTNAALQSEWWLSIWDSYWLTIWSNWLHWVTFASDTASWVEFPFTDNIMWKKLCWEIEWYAGTFTRRWNIWFSLDRAANYSNKSAKYNVVAATAWRWVWLWSLPWYTSWSSDWYRYASVSNLILAYRNWTSSSDITLYWDKWNKWLYWQPYGDNYSLNLPFTTWIYKGRWYCDFKNRVIYSEWETPNWTIKSFSRDFTSESSSNKDNLNTWLASATKYIRLTSGRWYWSSSDDVCYRRKAKVRYE